MVQSLPATTTIKLVTVIPWSCAAILDTAEPENGVFQTMYSRMKSRTLSFVLCGVAIVSAMASTGCQSSIGGQTLPSAYFLKDDVQYFVKGPEFKLAKEAAALKEARGEQAVNR
jgi:hypothetical protein